MPILSMIASAVMKAFASFSDNFNRVTSSGLGTSSSGGAWKILRGSWSTNGNIATTSDASSTYPIAAVKMSKPTVTSSLSTVTNGTGVALWGTDSGNWWAVVPSQDTGVNCNCSSCFACTGYTCNAYQCNATQCNATQCNAYQCNAYQCNGGYNQSNCQGNNAATCNGYVCNGFSYNCVGNYNGSNCAGYSCAYYYGNCQSYNTSNCTGYNSGKSPTCKGYNASNCKGYNSICAYYNCNGYNTSTCNGYLYSCSGGVTCSQSVPGNCTGYNASNCAGYNCSSASCTSASCISASCISASCISASCSSGYSYACNCSTCYPAIVQLLQSTANTVSEVTRWSISAVAQGLKVITSSGNNITARVYSDNSLTTQIDSDLTYTATGATIDTMFGIIVAPSNYSQGNTLDDFSATAN